jgi:glyoxylase-like metal-dependent hydrolase (beta-lactamase superfamily II)
MVKFMTPISKPQDNVIDQLKLLNMGPDDIDVVVNSHLHSDHCGCNAFFKKASFICHANELAAAQQQDAEKRGFLAIDWQQPVPTETIKAQKDLFNDGRIVLVPVPGHTPGMTGALIALDHSCAFFLASDSVALESNLLKDQIPRNMWSAELASQSMTEIRKIEAGGAKVLFGHDDVQYQSLRKGQEYYD